ASSVFPRNQVVAVYISAVGDFGLRASRGNERFWFPRARGEREQPLFGRAPRLADIYLPICGAHDHEPTVVEGMVNVPASRFLRPVGNSALLEHLRFRRISSAMETAARRRRLFHLWWHPHNFGVGLQENLTFLRAILDCFRRMQDRYGMRSMTMGALAEEVLHAGRPGRAVDV